jgi:thiol-disulfide isomerase/thioredoxin
MCTSSTRSNAQWPREMGTLVETTQDDTKSEISSMQGRVHSEISSMKELQDMKRSVFIMLYADWCGHCRNTKPDFNNFYHSKYDIVLVNADKSEELVKTMGAAGFPHFTIFNGVSFIDYNGPRNAKGWNEHLDSN